MDLEKLEQFIDLAQSKGVARLKYENGDEKISVDLVGAGSFQAMPMAHALPASAEAAATSDENFYEVKSPFVGTFYLQGAPGEPPYVKVGTNVSKGQVLCILEAMKIMNEIESETSGEIVEICAENESLVEYGQVLFKIRN
ncbi:MAG: acetyl-CoA carboxylase biotin carboxyl carrier protein [Bacteriovoracaceae bacterium]|jgi:acetyl-CoA carboxylase biotin carboxyl carrier protein|nr:acetyl-CoA carboxylase biotin carboxyl carrier protein [Bacteriovoracaceae bacterium]